MAQRGPVWEKIEYVLARLVASAVTGFEVETNQRTARLLGRGLDHFDARHRKRARHNIRLSFPHWSEERIARCATQSTQHLVQLAFETLHTPRVLTEDTWPSRVNMVNLGPAVDLLNSDDPVILLTGHLGNWEVLGYLLALLGYDTDSVARPLDNKLVNDWLMGIRENKGMRIITKFDATDQMVDVMRRGGTLGFIADQNAGEKGVFVPFFGRLASTYKSIGLLALQFNASVVCGYAHRIGQRFQFEMGITDIIRPEDWAGQTDPLYYVTARYCRAFETMVRMRPSQFLWSHRRWKSRPRHERQGKPLPRSLRQRLGELPWMTDELMHQIEHPPPAYAG
ncbi:MAG: lipid A biosynthesis acyltransferase [Planctomycetota bacterium]